MDTSNTAAIADYLVQAANIAAPWRPIKYQIESVTKTIHIWITRHPLQVVKKRNWLGVVTHQYSVSTVPPEGPDMQWRHLNFMDYTCMIHTTDVLDTRHLELPWFGPMGMPFTNRFARQLFVCLVEGMEIGALATLFNIPYADMWKFKFALDNGQLKFDYTPSKKPVGANTAAIMTQNLASSTGSFAAAPAASTPSQVPDASDPVWEQLITGDLNIQIKTLSFQLLLSKLRQQVSLQQTQEVKLMKMRELHRYVERNERSLAHELSQLRGHTTAPEAA